MIPHLQHSCPVRYCTAIHQLELVLSHILQCPLVPVTCVINTRDLHQQESDLVSILQTAMEKKNKEKSFSWENEEGFRL